MRPSLATPRLRLRPAGPSDLDALWALWAAPEVRRYLFDDVPVTRERTAEILIQAARAKPSGLGLWIATHVDTGELLGCAGLLPVSTAAEYAARLAGEVEPVVALAPTAWGQGHATEALAALLRYAFDDLGLDRLVAVVDVPNERSHRMVRRVGFVPTGESPGPHYRMRTYSLTAGMPSAGGDATMGAIPTT